MKLKISTIRGGLFEAIHLIIVSSYKLYLRSELKLKIRVKVLLLDDADPSNGVDDEKSWFMRMEVFDLICHQFLFTANCLGL